MGPSLGTYYFHISFQGSVFAKAINPKITQARASSLVPKVLVEYREVLAVSQKHKVRLC